MFCTYLETIETVLENFHKISQKLFRWNFTNYLAADLKKFHLLKRSKIPVKTEIPYTAISN